MNSTPVRRELRRGVRIDKSIEKKWPCGMKETCVEDESHSELHHVTKCDGMEHFTICSNPSDILLGLWSRDCTAKCSLYKICAEQEVSKLFNCNVVILLFFTDIDCVLSICYMVRNYNLYHVPEMRPPFRYTQTT